jgi:glyceraldehyde-3-phosphate dehydrogenase (NADP+)
MNPKPLLVGGGWRFTDKFQEVYAPYSGECVGRVCVAGPAEVDESISVAAASALEMRALPRYEVSSALLRMAHFIVDCREAFARAISTEAGKPITLARAETDRTVATFTVAAEEARRFTGEVVPLDGQATGKGRIGWTERVPRGVIFGITPFNFPLNLVAHKVAPALASGNSIIIKPSPRTPLTSLLLGEAFCESGFPPGAFQVVLVDVPAIDCFLEDERVSMISFTGSAEVGWQLRARAARKPVTLELGGNAPVIIDETADIGYAVERSIMAAFAYAGQTCISAQRFLVHELIADEWTTRFVDRAKHLRVGDPQDETTELSVMISEEAARRVESWIAEAVQGGARVLCGGGRQGSRLEATVLTDVTSEMRVCTEEVFAPVATIQTFSDFDQAIAQANSSNYGLQAGVFTRDMTRAFRAAKALEYGGVIVNDVPTFRVDSMPYGGVKMSGFGREGVRYAMEEMTEPRLIVINTSGGS